MTKYLDSEGLGYFLSKLKDNGFISSAKKISGEYAACKFMTNGPGYRLEQQVALPIFSFKVPKDVPAVIQFRTIFHVNVDINADDASYKPTNVEYKKYDNLYFNSTFFRFNQNSDKVVSTMIRYDSPDTNHSIVNTNTSSINGLFITKNDTETYTAIMKYNFIASTRELPYYNPKGGTYFNWFTSATSTNKSIDILNPVINPSEFITPYANDFGNYFNDSNMINNSHISISDKSCLMLL